MKRLAIASVAMSLASVFTPRNVMVNNGPVPRDRWRAPGNWVRTSHFGQYIARYRSKSRNGKAFQGKQEMARRVHQMANGSDCGQFNGMM